MKKIIFFISFTMAFFFLSRIATAQHVINFTIPSCPYTGIDESIDVSDTFQVILTTGNNGLQAYFSDVFLPVRCRINVFSILGVVLLEKTIDLSESQTIYKINTLGWNPGLYIFKAEVSGKSRVMKFIINR